MKINISLIHNIILYIVQYTTGICAYMSSYTNIICKILFVAYSSLFDSFNIFAFGVRFISESFFAKLESLFFLYLISSSLSHLPTRMLHRQNPYRFVLYHICSILNFFIQLVLLVKSVRHMFRNCFANFLPAWFLFVGNSSRIFIIF